MKNAKVAVVTGGNRGIGFEICRGLAGLGVRVLLTARDEAKGTKAARTLQAEGLPVEFRALDVAAQAAIAEFGRAVERDFGAADILVNNAGIMIDPKGARLLESDLAVIQETLAVNVYGPLRLSQALVPAMIRQNYGRVVNLSSGLGQLSEMESGTPAYRLSKTALNAVTRMLAAETRGANVLVNSMCPGWVRTEMGGPGATKTPAEGADTAIWLATLPDGGPSGGFFRDRQPIPW